MNGHAGKSWPMKQTVIWNQFLFFIFGKNVLLLEYARKLLRPLDVFFLIFLNQVITF